MKLNDEAIYDGAHSQPASNKRGNLLFVDDDYAILVLLHQLFQDKYDIKIARNGRRL